MKKAIRILQRFAGLPVMVAFSAALAEDPEIVDQPLPNGDFADGLSEWTVAVSPDAATPPGSITIVNGAARLAKGGAFVAELSQGFEAPEGLKALRLTLAELPQFGSSGGFIPEAFDIHLTGANGFSRVATFRPGASAAANAPAVPPGFNLGDGVTLEGQIVRIALDQVEPGEALMFAATLVGASVDTVGQVAIDDVVLEVETKLIADRLYGCGIFRDRFMISHGVAGISRCALGQINDTGIVECSDGSVGDTCPVPGLPGQDGDHGRDALNEAGLLNKLGTGPAGFDYTLLDSDGEVLPASAGGWACVRDNYAGLVWEVKVDDAADIRHFGHTFSWYQPDPASNGGASGLADGGSCTGASCDLQGLVEAVNEMRLCGASDWRVPTRRELMGLVNAGRIGPSGNPEFFPHTEGAFWTVTPVAAASGSAWWLDFADGSVLVEDKSVPLKVRLVREIK